MTASIYSPADLGQILGVSEDKVLEWRRTYSWPSFKIGRQIRFTEQHVEQIIVSHSVTPRKAASPGSVKIAGQTSRSASRRRSA